MAKKLKKEKTKKLSSAPRSFVWRCFVLLTAFAAFSWAIVWKLKTLQVDGAAEWQAIADRQQLSDQTIAAQRGNIYDAQGRVLAQSASVWTIEAAPNVMAESRLDVEKTLDKNAARVAANVLAPILGFTEEEKEKLYENLSDSSKKYYKIKGQVDQETADAVMAAKAEYNISGIYLTADTMRVYPYQELAATVLGFTGDGGAGREGLEYQYDEVLAGVPGRQILPVTAAGTELPTDNDYPYYEAEDGQSIVLTIDVDIQQVLEKYLAEAVQKYSVKERGMGIIVDVNTGAILGLSVYPAYNPNEPNTIWDESLQAELDSILDKDEYVSTQGLLRTYQWRNKILSDTYEPGSVMKIITAAAAYDSGAATEHSIYECTGGIMVEGWESPIRCALGKVHGQLSLRDALIQSCNECFVRISASVGGSTWYDYLNAFGLTEPTGVDLPGEPSQASLDVVTYQQNEMSPINLAVCSFGQGNKYTAMQMIMAVSAAVNGGKLMQPYIVQQVLDANGNVVEETQPVVKRQVISEETSAFLRDALEEMVSTSGSSGQAAYVAGYRVGGKSGTSQKIELMNTEQREEYIASFFGFAPADDPQIAVLIVMDEPTGDVTDLSIFGSRLAGPTVRDILKEVLPMVGVEPNYSTDSEIARSTVTVPKVSDLELGSAKTKLNTSNLNYEIIGSGQTVLSQYPAGGAELNYGGVVYLYTDPELGMETATVPDVTGKTPAQALAQLKDAGFNVLTSGAADNSSGAMVASQDLPPGTEAYKGALIRLSVE